MSSPLDGLASGLSTTELINQLIQLERAPQMRLVQKKAKSDAISKAIQAINSKLASVRGAARLMADPAKWDAKLATSSDQAVATASATNSALTGSLSFTVTSLAKTGSMASSGTVSSTSAVVSSSPLLLATGTKPLGIQSVKAGAGLTAGSHAIRVITETTAAVKTGLAPLTGATIDSTNDELNLTVDGNVVSITLDAGTYTAAELVNEINGKSDGSFTASLDDTGALVLTTAREGSLATIQVTGGDALTGLQLDVDGAAITGSDGSIEVNGVSVTIDSAGAGITKDVLSDDGGTITLTFAGGIRQGSITTTAIDTGSGSLADTAAAINAAKKGISAAVVQVAPGSYKLQLSATQAGIANDIGIAADAFTGLGALASTSVATDAVITVGTGPGQYTITSSTNTVSSLLPGVTLTLKSLGDVTITTSRNGEQLADGIKGLVDLANGVLNDINAQTAFNQSTKTGGLLMGVLAVRSLQTSIIDAVVSAVSTSALGSGGLAGLSTTKTGGLTFDRAKFLEAFNEDPDAVATLFRSGGTATDSGVAFLSATDRTRAGTYDVEITTAAEQATASGLTAPAGEVIAASETIDVRIGDVMASYTATAGESLTSIADGLNAALGAASLSVVATVESGRLVLRSTAYGSAAAFEVRSTRDDSDADQTGIVDDAGVWEAHAGVDVVGTINGVAATGRGQTLTSPASDAVLGGLALRISATTAGSLGSFTFVPGIAHRLATVSNDAIDPTSGALTALIEGRATEMARFDEQILRWETRIEMREKQLRKQFTAMEIALQRSQGQMQWLAGQIASMQANSNVRR